MRVQSNAGLAFVMLIAAIAGGLVGLGIGAVAGYYVDCGGIVDECIAITAIALGFFLGLVGALVGAVIVLARVEVGDDSWSDRA